MQLRFNDIIDELNTVSQSKQSNTSSSFNFSRPSGIAYIVTKDDCQVMGWDEDRHR